ncbi:MAG: thioredoxin family protein [Myxococcaceae bacterium]|nr:thioredoxin family protein [Myxococcaceae bacterium]
METTRLQVGTPETFDAQIAGPPGQLIVAYFWGPECPNCEVFARDLPGLLDALPPNVTLVKTNAYDHPELARRFAIFGIPAFVLFRDGKKLGMMRQYYGREYWQAVIDEKAAEPAPTQG